MIYADCWFCLRKLGKNEGGTSLPLARVSIICITQDRKQVLVVLEKTVLSSVKIEGVLIAWDRPFIIVIIIVIIIYEETRVSGHSETQDGQRMLLSFFC